MVLYNKVISSKHKFVVRGNPNTKSQRHEDTKNLRLKLKIRFCLDIVFPISNLNFLIFNPFVPLCLGVFVFFPQKYSGRKLYAWSFHIALAIKSMYNIARKRKNSNANIELRLFQLVKNQIPSNSLLLNKEENNSPFSKGGYSNGGIYNAYSR